VKVFLDFGKHMYGLMCMSHECLARPGWKGTSCDRVTGRL
jgi:hypothetical protein